MALSRHSQYRRRLGAAKITAVLSAVLLGLSACQGTVATRGNMPDLEELAEVTPGSDDRDTVINMLGTPSTLSTFEDNRWYYIGQKVEQVAFFEPDVLDRQILVITFDEFGVVEQTEFLGMEDSVEVDPVARVTPTEGLDFTIIQQLLGNFGRLPGAIGDVNQ